MDPFVRLTIEIIKEQENIIGPIALERAQKVSGLHVDWGEKKVTFDGNKSNIINDLVKQYQRLFGQTSIEVCKEAVRNLAIKLPTDQIPNLLR